MIIVLTLIGLIMVFVLALISYIYAINNVRDPWSFPLVIFGSVFMPVSGVAILFMVIYIILEYYVK